MTNPSANKRTKTQKEKDRVDIATLYLQNRSIREISKWIGENRPYTLSRHQVCEDLKAVRREWHELTTQATGAWVALQLAKLDRIESEAWEAWDRSKQERVTTRQSQCATGHTSESVEKAGQVGDSRYLATVLTCIERRSKLLGLDAPEKREVSGPDGGPIPISGGLNEANIDKLLAEYYANSASNGPSGTAAPSP